MVQTMLEVFAFLLIKKTNILVKKIYNDEEGRIMILDVKYKGMSLSLVNIYAPNDDDPNFFISVIELIKTVGNMSYIIGDDFNLVLDVKKDKVGGKPQTHSKAVKIVKEFMEANSVVDIWRHSNVDGANFTWYRKHPLLQKGLIFFWLQKICYQ